MNKLLLKFAAASALNWLLVSTPAAVILSDSFSYPDGPVTTVSAGQWLNHSGSGTADVTSGQLVLSQAKGEDVNAALEGQPHTTGELYARFKVNFSVLPLGTGGYFAHFKDAATGFRGRVFATTTGAATGGFRIGVSNSANAPSATIQTDLSLNTTYTLVLRWDFASSAATLWLDPAAETDPSVTATDTASAIAVTSFAFRQSTASGNGMGVLTADDLVVGISFADVIGSVIEAPRITVHPEPRTVTAGEDVTFTVGVSGTPPLTYEWFFGNNPIPNSNAATLTLTKVTEAQAGSYKVKVSNSAGSDESNTATLTVNAAPVAPKVDLQPKSQTVEVGGTVTFNVEASGTQPISYQWLKGTTEIPDATGTSLTLTDVKLTDAGEYSVRVSNAVDTVFSDKAVLTVTEPPPPAITKISHLHTLLDPDNFLPTDTATIFTSEGIVTTHINLTGTADALFYFQDDTGGIAVFVAGGAGVVPPAGAKVRVTAPLTHFNGLLEFRVTASNSDHKVVTLSTGNPLPEPLTLDLGAFAAPDPTAIEPIEGRLVQAVNVTLDTSTPNFRTGGENVTITDESGNPFTLRVDARTDIGGQVKPTGPVTIIGVLAQFDTSNPRTTGYQIIPSRFADILSSTKAPLIRFTNTLERLIRQGDQVVNTYVEHALHPGEKLTMEVAITDSENRVVTISADSSNLPASARWTLGATTGTSLSATFTFEPTANDAGKNVVVTLEARNDAAVNTATWTIYVPTAIESNVILSEFLPNPSSMATAPHFNPLNRTSPSPNASYEDEYVELANLNAADVDLVGWTIADSVQIRHKFYESFSVTSSNAIVVFGGPLDATFAPSLDVPNLPASEAVFGFGLNNGGDAILLRNAEGHLISRVVYAAADVSSESSLTRYPNLNGAFIAHAKVTSNYVSPGKQWNNRPFSEPAPSDPKPFSVIASRGVAGQVILKWTAEPGRTYSVWQASAITGPFASLATGLSFTNTEAEYTDNSLGNAGTRFYRVSTP